MKQMFLFAALVFSTGSFAQKVTIKPTFQQGQKLEVVTTGNTVISMEMMGQSMETKLDMNVTRHLDVEKVADGTTTIEHKMKRMQMNVESPMGGSQSFDSDKADDMKGEGGKAMEKALKNKFSMVLDANGRIVSVKTDDNNANKGGSATDNPMLPPQMGGLGEVPKAGTASEFAILPANPIGKGDTWSDTTGGQKAQYTVTDLTADEVILSFTNEGKTNRKQEANGMEILVNTTDRSTGTIRIDRKSGLLKERNQTTNSEGNMEMMGQTVPLNTKMSMKTVVNVK